MSLTQKLGKRGRFAKVSKYRTSFDPFPGAPHGGVGSGVDKGEGKTKLEGSKK